MTALSALATKAAEANKGYPLTLDDGTEVELKSVLALDKRELRDFSGRAKALNQADEDEDLDKLHGMFVEALCGVSDQPEALKSALQEANLGTLTLVFQEYVAGLSKNSKSEDLA